MGSFLASLRLASLRLASTTLLGFRSRHLAFAAARCRAWHSGQRRFSGCVRHSDVAKQTLHLHGEGSAEGLVWCMTGSISLMHGNSPAQTSMPPP
jgi:hypothetical protein